MSAKAQDMSREKLSPLAIFWMFLKLSLVGWGGPVARIALMHEEFVHRRKWISERQFGKMLAVYQALPGPEATELAVYFGYARRGRLGGLLSGLGFMLPGFLLMLLFTWLYASYGLTLAPLQGALYGVKPAVVALIAVALFRLSKATIKGWTLGAIAAASTVAFAFGVNFIIVLPLAGLAAWLASRRRGKLPAVLAMPALPVLAAQAPGLFWIFLKAGLLTFGGAYSVVSFIYQEAVLQHHWLTAAQYLDGIAIGQMLPAPVSIIGAFAGYFALGVPGAVLATIGVFLPAFLFTLVGFNAIKRLADNRRLQVAFDGVTAGVVGLLLATLVQLAGQALVDPIAVAIGIAALVLLVRKTNIAVVVLGAGALGWLIRALA